MFIEYTQLCAKLTNLRLAKGFSQPDSVWIWMLTSEKQGYYNNNNNSLLARKLFYEFCCFFSFWFYIMFLLHFHVLNIVILCSNVVSVRGHAILMNSSVLVFFLFNFMYFRLTIGAFSYWIEFKLTLNETRYVI